MPYMLVNNMLRQPHHLYSKIMQVAAISSPCNPECGLWEIIAKSLSLENTEDFLHTFISLEPDLCDFGSE
jgi:hypothetical protein